MAKVEITDEIVNRFCEAAHIPRGIMTRPEIKRSLEAAFNPEPRLPVTPEMKSAGERALKSDGPECVDPRQWYAEKAVEVYRAMRALEPEPSSDLVPQVLFQGFHDRKLMYSVEMVPGIQK